MKYVKILNVLIINDRFLFIYLEFERDSIWFDFNFNINYSFRYWYDKSSIEKKCLFFSE